MPDGLLACSSITTPSLARQKRMLSSTTVTSTELRVWEKRPLFCTGLILDFGENAWKTHLSSRLLRSLIGLKRVIMNAAHFLVMKNKEFYRFYQTEPFLETVSSQLLLRSVTHLRNLFLSCTWSLFLFFAQDDRRATQDTLPQRTLIELDPAGPRYSHHSLSPFISPPAFTLRSLISCSPPPSSHKQVPGCVQPHRAGASVHSGGAGEHGEGASAYGGWADSSRAAERSVELC